MAARRVIKIVLLSTGSILVPACRLTGTIQPKDERIVSPDVSLFQSILQALLNNGLVDQIFTVSQVLLFNGQTIEV